MVRIVEKGRQLVARMHGNIARDLASLMANEDTAAPVQQAQAVIARRSKDKAFS